MTLELPTPVPSPGKNICVFVRHLLEHPEDEDTLLTAVANPGWNPKILAKLLTEKGIPTSDPSIRRHRRGECSACAEKGYRYDAR